MQPFVSALHDKELLPKCGTFHVAGYPMQLPETIYAAIL
jgi:hypothetical protein